MGIKDRLDTLSRGELIGLAVVFVVTMAGAGLWYVRSLPKPVTVAADTGVEVAGRSSWDAPSGSPSPSAPPIIVDVTGWVHEPGVYEFAQGDRVIDAVERAGGVRNGADLSVLNLAAPLADGTRWSCQEGAAGGDRAGTSGSGSRHGLININTASSTSLKRSRASVRCWPRRSSTIAPRTAPSPASTISRT